MYNTKYSLLNLMLRDMLKQNKLYQPTSFWQHGSKLLIEELEKNDIENFRNLTVTRSFFVPGYSAVEYLDEPNKYDKIIDQFDKIVQDKRFVTRLKWVFNGYANAFNEYRVLKASNIDKKPFTNKVSESSVGNPIEQHTIENRNFSRSFLNYLLGLNFLKQNVDTSDISTVMEIGGGFGTLGEILLKDERNDAFYINLDIPPVAFYSSYYLQEVFGKDNIATYDDLKDIDILDISQLKQQYKAINTCSWQIEKIQGQIDLFVNFISFQEMEADVVQNYCYQIDRLKPKYILLRNILEGKKKKNENYQGGVEEPILGDDYNKFLPNYELIATDYTTFGFITEDNFHSQLRIYKRKE
jgi:putative sugar O-methyltransferase